jgi:hypothetical protein
VPMPLETKKALHTEVIAPQTVTVQR